MNTRHQCYIYKQLWNWDVKWDCTDAIKSVFGDTQILFFWQKRFVFKAKIYSQWGIKLTPYLTLSTQNPILPLSLRGWLSITKPFMVTDGRKCVEGTTLPLNHVGKACVAAFTGWLCLINPQQTHVFFITDLIFNTRTGNIPVPPRTAKEGHFDPLASIASSVSVLKAVYESSVSLPP